VILQHKEGTIYANECKQHNEYALNSETHVTRHTDIYNNHVIQGGSNMIGTDLCVNKPHCAAAVRP